MNIRSYNIRKDESSIQKYHSLRLLLLLFLRVVYIISQAAHNIIIILIRNSIGRRQHTHMVAYV